MKRQKTLLLMRHAKAERDETRWEDFDRPLSERGLADSLRMGQWLRQQQLVPDWICASSSVRTRMTAERVAEASGFEGTIVTKQELYHAPPRRYLTEMRQVSVAIARLLVIGHNPGLEELIYEVSSHAVTLPTAAIVHLQIPVVDWDEIEDQEWSLVETVTPKSLR